MLNTTKQIMEMTYLEHDTVHFRKNTNKSLSKDVGFAMDT